MPRAEQEKSKILLAMPEGDLEEALGQELGAAGLTVSRIQGDVIPCVFAELPRLIIVDEDYGPDQGRALALRVKEDMILRYIPIILLTRKEGGIFQQYPIDYAVLKYDTMERLMRCVREALQVAEHELDLNPLTRLPGVHSTMTRMDHAIQSKKMFAVLAVDLSNLEAYNTVYGAARGDEVIMMLASAVRMALDGKPSDEDFVGHLGGDDLFVMTRPEKAVSVAEAIIEKFDAEIPQHYDLSDRARGFIVKRNREGSIERHPLMRVFLAVIYNEHALFRETAELSRIAGQLRKYMMNQPQSCYVQYRSYRPLGEETGGALEVYFPGKVKSVRVAGQGSDTGKSRDFFKTIINEKKIRTVFQPIIDLNTRKIHGYEALSRGAEGYFFDNAAVLFAVARELARVKELDKMCIDKALKSAQGLSPDRKLFLNLNHETLLDEALMQDLFVERGRLVFDNFVIEVTEQSILRSFDSVRNALAPWRERGIRVAIDDVGGGAVSLRDVAVLKPDYIKFDRSLIRQMDTHYTKREIVTSLKLFADGIRALTTAEGIETHAEYEAVRSCGISLGQGFLFAKPHEALPDVVNF